MATAVRHDDGNGLLVGGAVGLALVLAVLFAIGFATRIDPSQRPIIEILGGGFIYNYRIAEVKYGLTLAVKRPLESGSIVEARFEDPGGGPDIIVSQRVSPMTNRYSFETPPVHGVRADRSYQVTLRALDRLGRSELYAETLQFRSQIDDSVVPKAPLTIGPGYHRNPDERGG